MVHSEKRIGLWYQCCVRTTPFVMRSHVVLYSPMSEMDGWVYTIQPAHLPRELHCCTGPRGQWYSHLITFHVTRDATRSRVLLDASRLFWADIRTTAHDPLHTSYLPLTLVETDNMADFRRRSVMQPPSDPYGSGRTNIPLPSTAKKQTHHGRMSMSGPAIRAPYPVSSVPGPTPRQSLMRSQNVNPLLMSVSKPSFGRTPAR